MHIITIASAPTVIQFVYKTKAGAVAALGAYKTAMQDTFEITDDFGQYAVFKLEGISSVVMEDCSLSRQAHIERSLHQQRMQYDAQKAAESDPTIRAAMRGPAVLSPMFNGSRN
jgi:hypothetical protein